MLNNTINVTIPKFSDLETRYSSRKQQKVNVDPEDPYAPTSALLHAPSVIIQKELKTTLSPLTDAFEAFTWFLGVTPHTAVMPEHCRLC